MKIISFGCSYTAGSEILDHLVHARAEHIKTTRGMLYWQQQHRDRLPLEQQHRLAVDEAELAWSGQLARRLGAELDCRAQQGCSLAETVHRVEKAWYQAEFNTAVLVLVGVPNFQRSIVWTGPDQNRSWIVAMPKTWPDSLQKLDIASITALHSDQYMMDLHLTYLLRLSQISETLGGKLIMFDMMGHISALDLACQNSSDHTFRSKWQEIIARGFTRFDICFDDLRPLSVNEKFAGGHAFVDVHEKFADWALQQLPDWCRR